MRTTACLLVLLCAAPAVYAQEPIEWSPTRRLAKEDFQGRVPVQAVNSSLSFLHVETSWQCVVGEFVASARAMFDPSRSWWRTSYGNIWGNAGERTSASRAQMEARRSVMTLDRQLLDHEQLHFDLAELAARKIRKRFEDFKDSCLDPGESEPIQGMVAEVDRELQEEQHNYDRETNHGVNVRMQDQWRRKILAQLKESEQLALRAPRGR
jgi:hypothetical protein